MKNILQKIEMLKIATQLNKKINPYALIIFIFFYILSYEIIFFYNLTDAPLIKNFINGYKLLFPFILLKFVYKKTSLLDFKKRWVSYYSISLILFLLLSLILSSHSIENFLYSFARIAPKITFFFALSFYFIEYKDSAIKLFFLIITFSVLSIFQFLLLNIYNINYIHISETNFGQFSGPYLLFGNITSRLYFNDFIRPIFRLHGFWNEPSNASAFMFCSYFLCAWIKENYHGKYWTILASVCFMGGLATLSMAGFLGLGIALCFGSTFRLLYKPSYKNNDRSLIWLLAGIFLILWSLGGRYYITNYPGASTVVKILLGSNGNPPPSNLNVEKAAPPSNLNVEKAAPPSNLNVEKAAPPSTNIGGNFLNKIDHALAGRLEKFIQISKNNLLKGNPSKLIDPGAYKGNDSPSYISYWFSVLGIGGLILILAREIFLLIYVLEKKNRIYNGQIYLYQACIVIIIQNLSYGNLMNPLYFTLASGTLFLMDLKDK